MNGKKHYKGELYFGDGSKYIGLFDDNEISGYGEYYWNDLKVYKGQWSNNKMNGKFMILYLIRSWRDYLARW